jgi:hypothetical protein
VRNDKNYNRTMEGRQCKGNQIMDELAREAYLKLNKLSVLTKPLVNLDILICYTRKVEPIATIAFHSLNQGLPAPADKF